MSSLRTRGPKRVVAYAGMALLGALAVVILTVKLAQSGRVKSQLGDKVFSVGPARELATEIATVSGDRGGPFLFQAPVGNRDIYLQHVGTDPDHGWLAFDAHLPGEARTCVLKWSVSSHLFSDPCGARTVPADGGDLPHYPAAVNGQHRVEIDFRGT